MRMRMGAKRSPRTLVRISPVSNLKGRSYVCTTALDGWMDRDMVLYPSPEFLLHDVVLTLVGTLTGAPVSTAQYCTVQHT